MDQHNQPLRHCIADLPIRECVYGVLLRDDALLLCLTKSGNRMILNFPGGAIDPQEDRLQALKREFGEEVGISIAVGRHLHSSDGSDINPDYPDNRILFHYYLVHSDEPVYLQGNNADVAELGWFKLKELPLEGMLTEQMLKPDAEFCALLPKLLATESKRDMSIARE